MAEHEGVMALGELYLKWLEIFQTICILLHFSLKKKETSPQRAAAWEGEGETGVDRRNLLTSSSSPFIMWCDQFTLRQMSTVLAIVGKTVSLSLKLRTGPEEPQTASC